MRKTPLISAIVLLVGLVFVYNQAIGDKPVSTVKSVAPAASTREPACAKKMAGLFCGTQPACETKAMECPKKAQAQWGGCSKGQAGSPQCAKAKAAAAQSAKNGSGCCAQKQAVQTRSACGDKTKGCPKPKQTQDSEKVSL